MAAVDCGWIVGIHEEESMSSDMVTLLTAIPWWAWIAIVAIVSGSITGIVKMRHEHAERMAMIQQGINPDAGKHAGPSDV
jgi:hypothetical protein